MRVLLQRKFALVLDGIDLSGRSVGEVFETPPDHARLLVAEGWAIVDRRSGRRTDDTAGHRTEQPTSASAPSKRIDSLDRLPDTDPA